MVLYPQDFESFWFIDEWNCLFVDCLSVVLLEFTEHEIFPSISDIHVVMMVQWFTLTLLCLLSLYSSFFSGFGAPTTAVFLLLLCGQISNNYGAPCFLKRSDVGVNIAYNTASNASIDANCIDSNIILCNSSEIPIVAAIGMTVRAIMYFLNGKCLLCVMVVCFTIIVCCILDLYYIFNVLQLKHSNLTVIIFLKCTTLIANKIFLILSVLNIISVAFESILSNFAAMDVKSPVFNVAVIILTIVGDTRKFETIIIPFFDCFCDSVQCTICFTVKNSTYVKYNDIEIGCN